MHGSSYNLGGACNNRCICAERSFSYGRWRALSDEDKAAYKDKAAQRAVEAAAHAAEAASAAEERAADKEGV